MKTVHNKIILDVNSIENKSVIVAKQADSMSRYIDITLQCAGEKITVGSSDRAVLMAADKSTGETVAMLDCTVEDDIITAELSESLLAVPGKLKCEVVVYGTDGSVLTSANFIVIVSGRIDGEVVEREADFSALQSALSDVASTSDRIDEVNETVNTRVQSIELGGTGASTALEAAQSLKVPSLDVASAITENSNLDEFLTPGTYNCTPDISLTLLNCPVSVAFKLYVINQHLAGNPVQILIAGRKNEIWFRGYTAANTYDTWRKVVDNSTLPSAAVANYIGSDIGKTYEDGTSHTGQEMLYGTDYDSLSKTGLYIIRGNNNYPTVSAPNDNNSNNLFYVFVMRYTASYYTQIAVNVRTENDVYIRSYSSDHWTEWKKFLNYDAVISESGTWVPASESCTLAINSANYAYNGNTVTVTASIECGDDISGKSIVITGLPVAAKSTAAGCGAVWDSDTVLAVFAKNSSLTVKSSAALTGKTIIVTATYIV